MTNLQMIEAVKRLADDLDDLIEFTSREIDEAHGTERIARLSGEVSALMNVRASLYDYFREAV